MKRMNVREFRAQVANLGTEPIEVVRYSETIGFWVPQALTKEPRRKPKVGLGVKPVMTDADFRELARKIKVVEDSYTKVFKK